MQDFFLKYLAGTFAVIMIIGPFFGGTMRPEDTIMGRARMLSDMRFVLYITRLRQSLSFSPKQKPSCSDCGLARCWGD